MTSPYTGAQPTLDPSKIIAGNSRLHDNWELRYAIIVDTLTETQGIARYDGDNRATVPVISLVGPLFIGQRVSVIFIPPSGNYVISSITPNTVFKIGEILLTAPQAVVAFGVDSAWSGVDVLWTSRDDAAGVTSGNYIYVQVNSDSGPNYRYSLVQVNNATVVGASIVGATQGNVGIGARGSASADVFGGGKITFTGWNAPHGNHLTWVSDSGVNDTTVAQSYGLSARGAYVASGPYTSLTFFPEPGTPNFVAGTQFTVYGRP